MSSTNKISIPIILYNTQAKNNIGIISNSINESNFCVIKNKEKKYNLIEKNPNVNEISFSGSNLGEKSKYLIVKYNESVNKLEAFPCLDWFSFTKYFPPKKQQTIEDIEKIEKNEKKNSNSLINILKKGYTGIANLKRNIEKSNKNLKKGKKNKKNLNEEDENNEEEENKKKK